MRFSLGPYTFVYGRRVSGSTVASQTARAARVAPNGPVAASCVVVRYAAAFGGHGAATARLSPVRPRCVPPMRNQAAAAWASA
jgi:hypothetical protein